MNSTFQKVLIVDDNEDVLFSLQLLLKSYCTEVHTERDPERIPDLVLENSFDVILLDMNFTRDTTSGREGFYWLETILGLDPVASVVVITGYGDVEMAVRALKEGAADFVLKPWDNDKLLSTLQSARRDPDKKKPGESEDSLRDEMRYAREVQERLFPQIRPPMQTLDYSGICKTAFQTGGDYYDFLQLGKGRLGLAVGDVSGKGVSAALLMASLQGRLQSFAPLRENHIRELMQEMNDSICLTTETNRYVTFFYSIYEDASRTLHYVNAGHQPPLLINANSAPELSRLDSGGTALGFFPNAHFEGKRIQLERDSLLVLFTDGLVEARNKKGQEFGDERLQELCLKHRSLSCLDLEKKILEEVARFSRGTEQHDDMTLVVAKVK